MPLHTKNKIDPIIIDIHMHDLILLIIGNLTTLPIAKKETI